MAQRANALVADRLREAADLLEQQRGRYLEQESRTRTMGARLDDEIGTVESVKAVSDMYSPVTGVVCEVNSSLSDNLDTLSSDPYGEGWICRISLSDPSELDALMDADAYRNRRADTRGEGVDVAIEMAGAINSGMSARSGRTGKGSPRGISATSATWSTASQPRTTTAAEAMTMPNNMEKLRSRVRLKTSISCR
mgnify:CR=1 FL=1